MFTTVLASLSLRNNWEFCFEQESLLSLFCLGCFFVYYLELPFLFFGQKNDVATVFRLSFHDFGNRTFRSLGRNYLRCFDKRGIVAFRQGYASFCALPNLHGCFHAFGFFALQRKASSHRPVFVGWIVERDFKRHFGKLDCSNLARTK